MTPLRLSFALILLVSGLHINSVSHAENPNSPPPANLTKPDRNKAAHAKGQPSSYQRGTEDAPVFMKGEVTTKKSEDATASDAQERIQKLAIDEKSVKYTRLQAVFASAMWVTAMVQVALFVWQLSLLRRTTKDAGIAANAALETARSITASERAYVFAKVEDCTLNPTHERTAESVIAMHFINHGKTPAIIVTSMGKATLLNAVPNEIVSITPSPDQWPQGLVIAADKWARMEIKCRLSHPEFEEVRDGRKTLYCFGWIKYKDMFNGNRETGYCWNLNPGSMKFEFTYSSQLNYCK